MNTKAELRTSSDTAEMLDHFELCWISRTPALMPPRMALATETDLANKKPNRPKNLQKWQVTCNRDSPHPPQDPERCEAIVLRNTKARDEKHGTDCGEAIWRKQTVLFSYLFVTGFRKVGRKPFVSYKEGDDNVAGKSKPIATSPNHRNGTKAPRKGYLPPWPLIPQQAYPTLPKVGHPQMLGRSPPIAGYILRPSVARLALFCAYSDRRASRGCKPSVLWSPWDPLPTVGRKIFVHTWGPTSNGSKTCFTSRGPCDRRVWVFL